MTFANCSQNKSGGYPGRHPYSKQPKPIDCPTIKEVESIIEVIHLTARPQARNRDTCMIRLMSQAGLRISELLGLVAGDVYAHNTIVESLKIRKEIAKMGSERLIPIRPETQAAISDWLHDPVFRLQSAAQVLFPRPGSTDQALSPRAVQKLLRGYSLAALNKPMHPHQLRHHAATELLKVTNMKVVQIFCGHKNISTTSIYAHPSQNDMKEAMNRRA